MGCTLDLHNLVVKVGLMDQRSPQPDRAGQLAPYQGSMRASAIRQHAHMHDLLK